MSKPKSIGKGGKKPPSRRHSVAKAPIITIETIMKVSSIIERWLLLLVQIYVMLHIQP